MQCLEFYASFYQKHSESTGIRTLSIGGAMKQLVTTSLLAALAILAIHWADAADAVSKDAARIEAVPIQTLTLSDEQFLKGDAYGRPTTIAGVLRVAQGSGRLPLVVLVPGSGGINAGADVWDRQFEAMGRWPAISAAETNGDLRNWHLTE
jgi:hypothetical protein